MAIGNMLHLCQWTMDISRQICTRKVWLHRAAHAGRHGCSEPSLMQHPRPFPRASPYLLTTGALIQHDRHAMIRGSNAYSAGP